MSFKYKLIEVHIILQTDSRKKQYYIILTSGFYITKDS